MANVALPSIGLHLTASQTQLNLAAVSYPLGRRCRCRGSAREIVPGVFRVGTAFVGCYAVDEAGAYTFIDAGLPGYGSR